MLGFERRPYIAALNLLSFFTRSKMHYSPACVPTGGTNDGQLVLLSVIPTLIPSCQEIRKHISQELQCDIFESPRRTVPKLQNICIFPSLSKWGGLRMSEGGVRSFDDGLEIRRGNGRGRNEEREDSLGKLRKGEFRPRCLPVDGQRRYMCRDVEPERTSA